MYRLSTRTSFFIAVSLAVCLSRSFCPSRYISSTASTNVQEGILASVPSESVSFSALSSTRNPPKSASSFHRKTSANSYGNWSEHQDKRRTDCQIPASVPAFPRSVSIPPFAGPRAVAHILTWRSHSSIGAISLVHDSISRSVPAAYMREIRGGYGSHKGVRTLEVNFEAANAVLGFGYVV